MKKSMTAAILVAGLAFAACSDDDGGSGSGSGSGSDGNSDIAKEVAKQTVDAAKADGVNLDEGCVADIADSLSDEDAAAIIAAGPDGDPEISPEGEEMSLGILACVDNDQLVEQFIQGMGDAGEEFDEACVREKLKDFDLSEVAQAGPDAEPPAEMVTAMIECFI